MSNLRLEVAEKRQMSQIKKLYKRAFPRNEKKPFFIIKQKQKTGSVEILSLDDGEFAGLCITMLNDDVVLLDYFAIEEGVRGKGYGGKTLTKLRERYKGKKLFLEIEQPDEAADNNEERVRRKQFYLRNGFLEAGIYVRLFGVDMELLCYDCELNFQEYFNLYRSIYGNFIDDNRIKQII